jgi:glycosyltransferase involved in cell wall biosynthesis
MPHAPVATIVIPCLNQAHYLHDALRSVAAQTVGPIETIVVDDGSTDATAAVARAAGARVLEQPTLGVSAARNLGLRAATSPYVIFLDADDELEPDAVATGLAVLAREPGIWMVARCCQLINAAGVPIPTYCPPPRSGDLYGEWLERNFVWTPGAAMFRREPLATLGGFHPDVGPAADYAIYLELSRDRRVAFDARTVVRYRQHATNMSRDAPRMLKATLAVLRRERGRLPRGYRGRFRAGLRAWQTFYGEQIVQQLRLDVRARRFGADQWRAVGLLVRECRGVAFTHLTRKLRRVAAGHPPSTVEPGRFTDVGPDAAPNASSAIAPLEVPR